MPGDDDGPHEDDAVDGVSALHQGSVQGAGHLGDHFESDKYCQDEIGENLDLFHYFLPFPALLAGARASAVGS